MCTGVRFSDDEGNMYFGRNLDWSFSYGETILVTPRGYQYDYAYGAEGKSEPNAVIGVGVVMVDRPMYFDCANEHGLAIAGLNFPGYASFAHEPVEGTENVATFEFPLWVTRNFDTVDEVEEALKNVTLVSQVVPPSRNPCCTGSLVTAPAASSSSRWLTACTFIMTMWTCLPTSRPSTFIWKTCATTCV